MAAPARASMARKERMRWILLNVATFERELDSSPLPLPLSHKHPGLLLSSSQCTACSHCPKVYGRQQHDLSKFIVVK